MLSALSGGPKECASAPPTRSVTGTSAISRRSDAPLLAGLVQHRVQRSQIAGMRSLRDAGFDRVPAGCGTIQFRDNAARVDSRIPAFPQYGARENEKVCLSTPPIGRLFELRRTGCSMTLLTTSSTYASGPSGSRSLMTVRARFREPLP